MAQSNKKTSNFANWCEHGVLIACRGQQPVNGSGWRFYQHVVNAGADGRLNSFCFFFFFFLSRA